MHRTGGVVSWQEARNIGVLITLDDMKNAAEACDPEDREICLEVAEKWFPKAVEVPIYTIPVGMGTEGTSVPEKSIRCVAFVIPTVIQRVSPSKIPKIVEIAETHPGIFVPILHADLNKGILVTPRYGNSAQKLIHERKLGKEEILEAVNSLVRYTLTLATSKIDRDKTSRGFIEYYQKAKERIERIREKNWKLREGELSPDELIAEDFMARGIKVLKLCDLIHEAKHRVMPIRQPYRFDEQADEFLGNLFEVTTLASDPFSIRKGWRLGDFDNLTEEGDLCIAAAKMRNSVLWFVVEKVLKNELSLEELKYEERRNNMIEIKYEYEQHTNQALEEAVEKAFTELKKWASFQGDKHFELRFRYFLGLVQISVAAKVDNSIVSKILLAEGGRNLHHFLNECRKKDSKRGVESEALS